MNKYMLKIIGSLILLLLLIPNVSVYADESSEAYIREMVELDGEESLNEEAEEVISALSQIEVLLVKHLYDDHVEIVLTENEFIELDTVEEFNLTGGRTLDDVAGFYEPSTKVIYIQLGRENDSAKTAVHEFGHALDYFLADNDTLPYSYHIQEEIEALIDEEKQAVIPLDEQLFGFSDFAEEEDLRDNVPAGTGYYDQTEEYFAETFAYYYMGGEQNEYLKENGPETYTFIESLPYRILAPTTYNAEEITISWTPHETVASYEIYQGEEHLDTVEAGGSAYTVEHDTLNMAGYADYQFTFKAMDDDGNEQMTSSIADTRSMPADISDLEELVAEAESVQERVHDDLDYIEDRLAFVYPKIEDYYDKDPIVRETVNQSAVVSYEAYLREIIQWFENDETYGESAERRNAAAGINEDDTEEFSYIILTVLGASGLALLSGAVVFMRKRSKKNKK